MDLDRIRDKKWTETAIRRELEKLASLPEGENVNKADSVFFAYLIKIAAVVKGSGQPYVTADQALSEVKKACSKHAWLQEKEIERQWKNALRLANPRFRRE